MSVQPDILWITCDQLRADALGCYGESRAVACHTPNIDRIAAMGVRFDNCYCNSPVCCPSRTSTLTGLPPEATGVFHNEARSRPFDASIQTFPQRFAACGYATANFGRMDVPRALRPVVWQHHDPRGATGEIKKEMGDRITDAQIGASFRTDVNYPSDQIVEHALQWMDRTDGPKLTRVSFFEPHPPCCPPTGVGDVEVIEPDDPPTDGLGDYERAWIDAWRDRGYGRDAVIAARRNYGRVVQWLDTQVGRLLDVIDPRRTIVVFNTDHGATLGEWGCFGKNIFRRASHRAPTMIAWPGALDHGAVRDDPCESRDLGATLLSLAGFDREAQQCPGECWFDGAERDAAFATIGHGEVESFIATNSRLGRFSARGGAPRRICIRTQRYRLERNVRMDDRDAKQDEYDTFLADCRADPDELQNLANDRAMKSVVDDLLGRIDQHLNRYLSPMEANS